MNNYVVYVHINKINNKTYVGQTNNVERRWRNNGIEYEKSVYFYSAILKYGWDAFEHKILLKDLTKEEADYYENYYIESYNSFYNQNGYNIRSGGSNGKLSEATKQKLSDLAKAKGNWKGDKNPRHINPLCGEKNGMYGKKHTEETKLKISNANRGRIMSEEQKNKIKLFMNTQHPEARKVRCIETGEIFLSARKATQAYGGSGSSVARVCNGERKTFKGRHWEWIDD